MVATLVVALLTQTRLALGLHLLSHDVMIAYLCLLVRSRDQTLRRARAHRHRQSPEPASSPRLAPPPPETALVGIAPAGAVLSTP